MHHLEAGVEVGDDGRVAMLKAERRIGFFAGLSSDILQCIAKRLIHKTNPLGHNYFHCGQPADRLYLLRRGTVFLFDPDDRSRKPTEVRHGESLSEMTRQEAGHPGAAMAVFLGIMLDGIPESLDPFSESWLMMWVEAQEYAPNTGQVTPSAERGLDGRNPAQCGADPRVSDLPLAQQIFFDYMIAVDPEDFEQHRNDHTRPVLSRQAMDVQRKGHTLLDHRQDVRQPGANARGSGLVLLVII